MKGSILSWLKYHPKTTVAAAILLIPILINALMYLQFPSPISLHAPDWLSFWGTYIGGLAGTISGLIALFATYKQAERHHKDDLENRRLSIIPVIDLHFLPVTTLPTDTANIDWCFTMDEEAGFSVEVSSLLRSVQAYVNFHPRACFYLEVTNIGIGPAVETTFSLNKFNLLIGSLSPNSKRRYIIALPRYTGVDKSYDLLVGFTDAYGNEYSQTQKIDIKGQDYSIQGMEPPIFKGRPISPS